MILILFLSLLLSSQGTIVVHVDSDNPFAQFEQEVIQESIKLFNKLNKSEYKIKLN
jgi:hypothetical protein